MTKIGEVSVRKRRSRHDIKRLVAEFETGEFCQKYNLALGTLQRGLRKRRMEVEGQSEAKRLVEVKLAGIQRNGSGPGTCSLEVVLVGTSSDWKSGPDTCSCFATPEGTGSKSYTGTERVYGIVQKG